MGNVSLSQTNAALNDLGLTPIKLHNLSSHSKESYYKRKIEKVTKEVKKKISKALDYDIEMSEDEKEDKRNFIKKAEDFDKLNLGARKKVATEFQVTKYMVQQARKLKREKGILAIPDPKKGNTLSETHNAVRIDESYKDLIKMLVCNVENGECMLSHCDNCPSDDALIEYLTAKLSEDYNLEEEIIISQWFNTDRTEMVKQSISTEGFISLLSKSVENLIPHSYITKSQSKIFKKLKEDPPLNTAINKGGCTILPVGLYLKKDDKVLTSNHCFISDDLQHDTCFVNYVKKRNFKWLKENHPEINQVHYFTDGCAGQYKNRNSFKNLTNHHKDFGMKAEHSFFATSHGKSICDGLGGTVKRIFRKGSLQLSDENQIKTATQVYDFCKVNIEKINFHFIDKKKC
ncbi:hypothetical protein QYM36_016109 [Artemia franciscana]|uniref:Uncharacterized protein n=1 Tax=Artemia franciscana TaxID=6661 RepID=A0AA88HHZ4_ARTSF|nr:hypothetical protein QYM36_016109 [Artemia franciscana]